MTATPGENHLPKPFWELPDCVCLQLFGVWEFPATDWEAPNAVCEMLFAVWKSPDDDWEFPNRVCVTPNRLGDAFSGEVVSGPVAGLRLVSRGAAWTLHV